MSSLAVPRVNPDRCPVHESPARMSTYRHARRVLRPNRIKETSRSSHERGHAYTQMSWSRCCHVAAGCALSMQGTSAGNRIKETTRTRMKETIRNVRLRRSSTRRAYRYVDMRAGLSSTEGRPVGPAGHRSGLTSGAAKEAMTFAPTIDVIIAAPTIYRQFVGRLLASQ